MSPKRKEPKKPDLLSGLRKLREGISGFEKLFTSDSKIKKINLKPSELNNETRLEWLHNNKLQVEIESVLENKGSVVLKVGKPKFLVSKEPIPICPASEVLPVTILTPYTLRLENGNIADKFIVMKKYEYKLPIEIALPRDRPLDYIKGFLRDLERKEKIRLPWLDKVTKLNVLFKKLKKEGVIPPELIDLNSIKSHKDFLREIQHYKIREYHKDSLIESSFHKSVHFNGTIIAKVRKLSLSEKGIMKKLGLEPKEYVLEIVDYKENPDVSPEERLKQLIPKKPKI